MKKSFIFPSKKLPGILFYRGKCLSQHFPDAAGADGNSLLHLFRRDDEGRVEVQHVAQRAEQQSLFEGFLVNLVAQAA